MQTQYNLTEGPILGKLFRLSLPIMATSFMEMAYNITDMFWLSRLSEGAVAAAGVAGLFLWMSTALMAIGRMGSIIGVSQSMGKDDTAAAKQYAQNAFVLALILGIIYAAAMIIFRAQMIGAFAIDDPVVVEQAKVYLAITAIGIPLIYAHSTITGIFNGFGNTKLPFYIDSTALGLNIILSPVLIFIFDLGLAGAAIGTVIASAVNLMLKLLAIKFYKRRPFERFRLFSKLCRGYVRQIIKWGLPVTIEIAVFASAFMLVTRFIAAFGMEAVAAHQVGTQVEALAFMVAVGFAGALTAFVGQNYGAERHDRIRESIRISNVLMGLYGLFITAVLFFAAMPMVSLFLRYPESIAIATSYLRIIALAQFLFCMENVAVGSFRGCGQTIKPTIVSMSSNVFRVGICYVLAATALGIDGIWWGIVAAMTLRAVWLLVWHWVVPIKQKSPNFDK